MDQPVLVEQVVLDKQMYMLMDQIIPTIFNSGGSHPVGAGQDGGGGATSSPTSRRTTWTWWWWVGGRNTEIRGDGGSGTLVVRKWCNNRSNSKTTGGAIDFWNNSIFLQVQEPLLHLDHLGNCSVCWLLVVEVEVLTGGAGAWREGTTPISGPTTVSVQVGAGGMFGRSSGSNLVLIMMVVHLILELQSPQKVAVVVEDQVVVEHGRRLVDQVVVEEVVKV